MEVQRIIHEGPYGPTGSHIEPPFEESWSELEKLQWKAGVVKADTGLHVQVTEGGVSVKRLGRWVPLKGVYGLTIDHSLAVSSMPYRDAWTYMNGMMAAGRVLNRQT